MMALEIDEVRNRAELERVRDEWRLRRPPAAVEERRARGYRTTVRVKVALLTVVAVILTGLLTGLTKAPSRHHRHPPPPPPDNYTIALRKSLAFFNAQRSGKLRPENNVSWRGDSCLNDGSSSTTPRDLSGGYYDGGSAIKSNFPQSFAMTMLSWSVLEYRSKYEAAGELGHVKSVIKWATDYFLKTFDHTADSIELVAAQVGMAGGAAPNDHICWMRPEDIDYERVVIQSYACSDLAAEMAAALASAAIVFRNDDEAYARKLIHGAEILFRFARDQPGRYSDDVASLLYNSTGYWDEIIWGSTWLYYATGSDSYLQLATSPDLAEKAGAFQKGPSYGVLSWDNKLIGSQVLLTRFRIFLSPGYPYEEVLKEFHDQAGIVMCSFLPDFTRFNRTRGGMIQLNHGAPQPLQYVVNAAFLATVFSDYLKAFYIPGWYCGPHFFTTGVLREFAETQMKYILGENPRNMSYVVGYGSHYPKQVHHRGASIPKDRVKYNCKGGWKWRDSEKANPNTIVGAMVAGPDRHDGFEDVRSNYNYTEPTLAGNAGLVAALVALSGESSVGIDKNTIFSAIPPMYVDSPPPPPPWQP